MLQLLNSFRFAASLPRALSRGGRSYIILLLFFLLANNATAGEDQAYTFLRSQMDKYITTTTPRLLESYSTPYPPGPYDARTNRGDLYKIAFTYDNALAAIAFIMKGQETPGLFDNSTFRAKLICKALVWHLSHDPSGVRKLRDAYYADQNLNTSQASLIPQTYDFSKSSLGNLSWVIITLLRYYTDATDDDFGSKIEFLNAAAELAEYIHTNLYDASNLGYFHNIDANNAVASYKSAEQNINTYVAFMQLFDITKDIKYKTRALYAKAYVEEACYNKQQKRFFPGSGVNNSPNDDVLVADVNSLSALAFGPSIDWQRPIEWAVENLGFVWQGYNGIDFGYNRFTESGPDGVWFEGTAQLALAYKTLGHYGLTDNSQTYIDTLNYAQGHALNQNANSIVSASKDNLTTGFGWSYFASGHIAATSWYIAALKNYNPFWGSLTNEDVPYSNIAFKKPVNLILPMTESDRYCIQRGTTKDKLTDGDIKTLAYPGMKLYDPDNSLGIYRGRLFDYEIDLGSNYQVNLIKLHFGYFGKANSQNPQKPYISAWRLWYLDTNDIWQTISQYIGVPNKEIIDIDTDIANASKLRITAWGFNWSGVYELFAFGREAAASQEAMSLLINNGTEYTRTPNVNFYIDGGYGSNIIRMSLSQNGQDYTSPMPFQRYYNYTFPDTEGQKSLYVKTTDTRNNSQVITAGIILDKTAPQIQLNQTPNGALTNQDVYLNVSATDNFTAQNEIIITGDSSPYTADGAYNAIIQTFDKAGNSSSFVVPAFTIDKTPPQGSVSINSNNQYTNLTIVTLALEATDATTSVTQMCFSNDDITYTRPQDYLTEKTWILSRPEGEKQVFVKFKDLAGNWSSPISNSIILDTTAPTITITNPPAVTNQTVNLNISITDNFTPPDEIITTGANSIYEDEGAYSGIVITAKDKATNIATLSVASFTIDKTPPSAFTVQDSGQFTNTNNQLTANWTDSSDSLTGLTGYQYALGTTPGATDTKGYAINGLNKNVTIKDLSLSHGPTYYISVRAYDNAGNYTEGRSDGIKYDNPPKIDNFTITGGPSFHQNSQVILNAASSDIDNDEREYKYAFENLSEKENGIIQDYSAQSQLTWSPLTHPKEIIKETILKVFVRAFGVEQGPLEKAVYIFRKPINAQ